MKIQVAQLKSSALAWAVATARGHDPQIGEFGRVKVHATKLGLQSREWVWFRPDDDWRQCGPLLDELYAAGLELRLVEVCQKYRASLTRWETSFFGDTPAPSRPPRTGRGVLRRHGRPSRRIGGRMRLTASHVAFWRAKKSPAPAWFGRLTQLPKGVDIHTLVNDHAGIDFRPTLDAHNTLGILHSARRRGELVSSLTRMAASPGTVIRPQRRAAYCKKWLAKIQENAR